MNSTVKHYPRNAYLRMHRKSACVETLKSIYEKWLPTRVADASHASYTVDGVVYLTIGH